MDWLKDLGKYTKAVAAALVAAYAVYQIATGEGSPAGMGVTFNEWVSIISTAVVTAGAVWAVPNSPE